MKNSILASLIALTTLLSTSLGAAEWTNFPLATGARAVYVSSSEGNDANDGLSPASAKRTISGTPAPTPTNPNGVTPGGFAVVRNGLGDHLYLKRGDTFAESRPLVWNKSGLSAAYPAVFGTYGEGPRPIIDRGAEHGMHISPVTGPTVRYVAVTGIHFRPAVRDWHQPGFLVGDGQPGIFMAAGANAAYPMVEDVLIEDCKFEYLGGGVSMVGRQLGSIRNVRINRSVFIDIYVRGGHTNAVYASNVTGLTLEENVIDGVQRTAEAAGVAGVMDGPLSHSVYVQSDSRDVVLQNNIMANTFDGGMMRPGGLYAGNLAFRVGIGTHQGYMFSASAPIITGGVDSTVTNNAFLGPWQYGVQIGNIRTALVEGNVLLGTGNQNSVGFNLIGRTNQDTAEAQYGLRNLTLSRNFVHGTQALTAAGPEFVNITVRQNELRSPLRIVTHIDYEAGDFLYDANEYRSDALPNQANQWFRVLTTNYTLAAWRTFMNEPLATEAPALPAPVPTIANYQTSIGQPATEAAFLAAAREQSRQSWDVRYTAPPVIDYLKLNLGLMNPARRRALEAR